MKIVLIVIAVLVVVGVAAYFVLKKKGLIDKVANRIKAKKVDVATVDGECRLDDCVSWLKALNLNKETDTPFIADYTKLKEKLAGTVFDPPVTKPCAIVLGVFNAKKDELTHVQVIQSDKFDDKVVEVLGTDPLVVLN